MRIEGIRISRQAAVKMAGRGIEEWEPYEVLFNGFVVVRNKRNRAGTHRMIGRADSGRLLTLPIRKTEDDDIWLVVNGWIATKGERTLYEGGIR